MEETKESYYILVTFDNNRGQTQYSIHNWTSETQKKWETEESKNSLINVSYKLTYKELKDITDRIDERLEEPDEQWKICHCETEEEEDYDMYEDW